jgi:hypothetical protein
VHLRIQRQITNLEAEERILMQMARRERLAAGLEDPGGGDGPEEGSEEAPRGDGTGVGGGADGDEACGEPQQQEPGEQQEEQQVPREQQHEQQGRQQQQRPRGQPSSDGVEMDDGEGGTSNVAAAAADGEGRLQQGVGRAGSDAAGSDDEGSLPSRHKRRRR